MDATARRLRDELRPVGVAVSKSADQRLWIRLPADAVFLAGQSALKPPATPWLDMIAATLREQPRAVVQIIAEPDAHSQDGTASRVLALDRAASARDWIVARGVSAQRMSVAGRRISGPGSADERRLDIFLGERAAPER